MPEFYPQHRSLNSVQPEIATHKLVKVLGPGAMIPQQSYVIGECWIVRRHHTPISKTAQVLGRKEAEAAQMPHGAGPSALVFRTYGLSGIFDNVQIVAVRDLHDRVDVSHLAKEVNRDDGACALRDLGLNGLGVDVVR